MKFIPTTVAEAGNAEVLAELTALGLGITWIVNFAASTLPFPPYIVPPWMIGLLVMGTIDAYLVFRSPRIAGWVTLLFVVFVGVGDRLLRKAFVSSDVLSAT